MIEKQNKTDFKTPYEAGYDCGLHGSNTFNSHYKWFSSKESMEEWSKGKKNAEEKNFKSRKNKEQ